MCGSVTPAMRTSKQAAPALQPFGCLDACQGSRLAQGHHPSQQKVLEEQRPPFQAPVQVCTLAQRGARVLHWLRQLHSARQAGS